MHFDSSLFLAALRMSSNTLEEQVGKQGDGGGVDYLQAFHPLGHFAIPAVRRKCMPVSAI